MKSIFLMGGLTGFSVAIMAGWAADRAAASILLDAMFGAVAGAFLFRWFWSVVLRGMRETYLARQAEATRHAEPPAEAKKRI
jgi:hypothetical protein